MSIQGQRLPLGEFSNSRLNRVALLSSGNNNIVPTNINNIDDALPITTTTVDIINSNSVSKLVVSNNENIPSFNFNGKPKPNLFQSSTFPSMYSNYNSNNISGNTNTKDVNESPTNRILGAIITRRKLDNNSISTSSNVKSSNVLQFSDDIKKDYSEISKRLQIRLRFAYYKLQTKQMDLKFADLKNKMYMHSGANTIISTADARISLNAKLNRIEKKQTGNQQKTKRRKLVVSQGNYKTPAKNHPRIAIEEVISHDTMMSTPSTMVDTINTTTHYNSLDANPNGIITSEASAPIVTTAKDTENEEEDDDDIEEDDNETLTQNNNTTLLNCSMTPIRNPIRHLPNGHSNSSNIRTIQETPVSVKAAKSLIQLFSSINTKPC